jgi:hypothetical protein
VYTYLPVALIVFFLVVVVYLHFFHRHRWKCTTYFFCKYGYFFFKVNHIIISWYTCFSWILFISVDSK